MRQRVADPPDEGAGTAAILKDKFVQANRSFRVIRHADKIPDLEFPFIMRNFKPFENNEEIIHIGTGLLERSLPKTAWTHAAHFAAAAWLLERRKDMDVAREMPGFIRAYNEATGVTNDDHGGYHETITQASIRATRAFLAAHTGLELFAAVNELMRSPLGQPEWLLAHWSRERLFSVEARRRWCEPDLAPLPF